MSTATDILSDALSVPTIQLTEAPAPTPDAAPDVLPTPAVRLILNRIAYGVSRKAPLIVVAGYAGTGKSTSARLYAANDPRALYVVVKPDYSPREIVADLCRDLGIQAGEAWRVRTSVLVEHLTQHPRRFLFDEAQRLDYKALDMLKYIADATGSTFVLLGNEWLDNIIDRHSDIHSRAWVRVRPQKIELDAFSTLYAPRGYSPATLKAIHAAGEGVMRKIVALLDHLDEGLITVPGMTRANLTPEQVRGVAAEVLS